MDEIPAPAQKWTHWPLVCAAPFAALIAAVPASAGDGDQTPRESETYVGAFAGFGRADNRIIDLEGFANWGNPGWAVDYRDIGLVGGLLFGNRLAFHGMPLKVELDGMTGGQSASSNQLDPEGLDETVKTEFRWVAAARAGIELPVGPAVLSVSGGPALARMDSSVTDIDFGQGMPERIDPDDSFRDRSTALGWTVGAGVEAPLNEAWSVRLEGLYYDFGRSTHHVNRSGDNRCGPEKSRRPCPYHVENKLGVVRLALVRRFGP